MDPVLLIVALFAVFVVFGFGMMLQGHRRRLDDGAVIYGVDDAIVYIWERLPENLMGVIDRADIRRILEWEMLYLQQPSRRSGPAIVGGLDAAAFVQQRAYETGHPYEPEPIFAVLDLQADYLQAIGAIGNPVEPEPDTGP